MGQSAFFSGFYEPIIMASCHWAKESIREMKVAGSYSSWPSPPPAVMFGSGEPPRKKWPLVLAGLTVLATCYNTVAEHLPGSCEHAVVAACSKTLDKKLFDPDVQIRRVALEHLLKTGTDSLHKLTAIAHGLKDEKPVQDVALSGAGQLRADPQVPPQARKILDRVLTNRPYTEPYESVDIVRWAKVSYDGGKTTVISPVFGPVIKEKIVTPDAFHQAQADLARWAEEQR